VKRFRGGLVFKAHRHSTLGSRVIKEEEEEEEEEGTEASAGSFIASQLPLYLSKAFTWSK
jgi:hypothetical protein